MERKKKVALVTGGNSGMGKASCAALADQGFHVLLLARSREKGEAAMKDLEKVPGRSVELLLCDLADPESIKGVDAFFKEKNDTLDVLLNNAGVITLKREETKEGHELQFGVNHLGHFLLTKVLLPYMASGSRIINVSSGAHKWGKIHFEDLSFQKGYRPFKAYGQSKLANVLFTKALAEKLLGLGITVNACHPGAVGTQMGVDRKTGFGQGLLKFLGLFFLTPEEGARTAVYLATSREVEGVSGQYFFKRKAVAPSERGQNIMLARELFKVSETLTEPYKW